MGVPAFYRWLSEKYPKIIQDILEERVQVVPGSTSIRLPFDATKPNPSGLECDHLYIDMNGIIHPCSHPEVGPQPSSEEEMYANVCAYIDRLIRLMRPRKLLYLAIDGVAPRAKMNQQRSRRFRSAQEARELLQLEQQVRIDMGKLDDDDDGQQLHDGTMIEKSTKKSNAWDSNVITPGTPFMLNLATYIRFYIRKRIAEDKAWENLRIIFSDASIPGEGEHKIMRHIRLQRSHPGYNPNLVHVLHGLDADLIMLALATHEIQFYISREEVLFGRQSQEQQEERQLVSGFRDAQRALDEQVGSESMQLIENNQKPIQRISIPILREYLANEFASCITTGRAISFEPNFERLIDDIVFLCFFVGNDFLPHLPSLDIRDGALDFLFNIYKRLLPSFGDYMTKSGGNVNLSYVDVILSEVGTIEDYVFQMKYENEQRDRQRREEMKTRNKKNTTNAPPPPPPPPQLSTSAAKASAIGTKVMGRAARILAKQQERDNNTPVALSKKTTTTTTSIEASHMKTEDNLAVALALKKSLATGTHTLPSIPVSQPTPETTIEVDNEIVETKTGTKRKFVDAGLVNDETDKDDVPTGKEVVAPLQVEEKPNNKETDTTFEFDADDDDDGVDGDLPDVDEIIDDVVDPEIARLFKERVKKEQQNKLDEHVKTIEDKVRLHEPGWKDRYYTDKCKADDVENHGGREHLFRSYVMGLCWVMKYYYDGCPSWKWYYPFHYGPFASDLKNIERFELDCKSFELNTPFNPVEQLMAVLPSDSSHAIPKESRWLMEDPDSPIIDFYPKEVPVDPNGKAMPWLWVVLLPFIDEDRLLAAMSPTMAKWEKTELLCNARGLDDGYLFVHRKNPLTKKLSGVLQIGKTNYTTKLKLTDAAAYGCPGFNGSIRAPLSNEIYPIDEDAVVLPPPGSDKISRDGGDYNIFSDSIDPNEAVCVAFTEPPKLSHRSIILPGAHIPDPILTDDDRRIRRPKLNRGGGSIAHMGMSNGQSHQQGYGSMNIGSFERNLAQQNGRGNDMYQTGNRPWGAMEPLPKRPLNIPPPPPPPPPHMSNPNVNYRNGSNIGMHHQSQWQAQSSRGPPQPPNQHFAGAAVSQPPHLYQGQNYQAQQNRQGYQAQQQFQYQAHGPLPPPGYGNGQHLGYGQQALPPHGGDRAQGFQQGHQLYNSSYNTNQGTAPLQQGFNFRSFSQVGSAHAGMSLQQQNAERRSRASADVMNSLRAQLSSTLNQKKNGNQTNPHQPR
jgi:5'-3' exoribonuclease 2